MASTWYNMMGTWWSRTTSPTGKLAAAQHHVYSHTIMTNSIYSLSRRFPLSKDAFQWGTKKLLSFSPGVPFRKRNPTSAQKSVSFVDLHCKVSFMSQRENEQKLESLRVNSVKIGKLRGFHLDWWGFAYDSTFAVLRPLTLGRRRYN